VRLAVAIRIELTGVISANEVVKRTSTVSLAACVLSHFP